MLDQRTLKPRTIFCHDNLPILRGINSNSIDLIYLDPPFNKGKKFHAPIGTKAEGADFHDIWSSDEVDDAWHIQLGETHPYLYKFIDAVEGIGSKPAKYYLIYMAMRLMEMRRVLKDSGCIYLHCDPTASHYLKLLMDGLFGHENFRNEIVWKRSPAGKGAKKKSNQYPNNTDIILFYSKSSNYRFEQQYKELSDKQKKAYRYTEADTLRDFKTSPLGDYSQSSIDRMQKEGLIYKSRTGKQYKKYYLDEASDTVGCIWSDIKSFNERTNAKEYMKYPTQKPLELLERVILASSNEGDVVLDPFCGCATTCVAAEKLARQWIGIDVSDKAYELVKYRIENEISVFVKGNPIPIYREDVPKRTDIDEHKKEPTPSDKQMLFAKQNGKCNGCKTQFEIQHLTIDHIIPQSHGGHHEMDNLQLLCSHCNSTKGNRPMEYLLARLASR